MADTGAKFIITEIKGEAYVRKENGEIIKLNAGDILEEGDVLLTGDGEVTLADESGAELTVPANYTLTLAATLPPELPDSAEEIPAGDEAPLPEATDAPDAPAAPQEQAPGPDGPGISDGGGSSFFNAPKTDYLLDDRFIDQGNLNRDVNEIFSFMGRHTENPRIHYRFDLDRVQFPLYGPELDQWGGGRRDDYTPPIGQHEPDNSDLDGRFELAPDANSVKEDGPLTASGSVLANDSGKGLKVVGVMKHGDPGAPSSGNVGSEVQGEYGTVKINADGTYTYVLDNDDDRVQALAVGEKFTETFVYSATDQRGETQTTTLTITINGTNDDPKISVLDGDSDSAALIEGDTGLTADGTLSIADVDTSDKVTVSVKDVQISGHDLPNGLTPQQIEQMLTFGSTTLLKSGETEKEGGIEWKFDSGSQAFNFLPSGEKLTLTYTVEVDDGHGGKDTHPVTITITGTNDAPTAVDDSNSVRRGKEGSSSPVITGNVLENDSDPEDETLEVTKIRGKEEDIEIGTEGETEITGTYGTLYIKPDGSYRYQPDDENSNVSGLKWGDKLEDKFEYEITDGHTIPEGYEDHKATLTIEIRGLLIKDTDKIFEDGPPAEGNVLTNDREGSEYTLEVIGVGPGSDPESTATPEENVGGRIKGTYGWVTINKDGSYTYELDNDLDVIQALAEGEDHLKDYFVYKASDGKEDDSTTLTITIHGANDAPKITLEDGDSNYEERPETDSPLEINGNLSLGDVDKSDEVRVDTTGVKVYLDDVELTEKFPGGLTEAQILAMFSVNDQPVLDSNTSFLKNGIKWNFDSDEEAFNFLPEGKELKFVYTVEANDRTDDTGLTDTETVTIVIKGTNDAPELESDSGRVKEDGAEMQGTGDDNTTSIVGGNVLDNDKDVDIGDVLRVTKIELDETEKAVTQGSTAESNATVIDGVYGKLYIGADGTYKYVLNNDPDNPESVVQALAKDQTETEEFTYTVTDGQVEKSTTLTITVEGTNDNPEIRIEDGIEDEDGDTAEGELTDEDTTVSGTLTPYDVDTNDNVLVSIAPGYTKHPDSTYQGDIPEDILLKLPGMFKITSYGETIQGGDAGATAIRNVEQTVPHGIKWQFAAGDKDFEFLPTDETLVLVYTVKLDDQNGGTTTQDVTITVTGTDDYGELGDNLEVSGPEDEVISGNIYTESGAEPDPDEGEYLNIARFKVDESEYSFYPEDDRGTEKTVELDIGTLTLTKGGDYTFTPKNFNYSGPVPTVTYWTNSGDHYFGDEEEHSRTLDITVNPVSDAPDITVANVETPEDPLSH